MNKPAIFINCFEVPAEREDEFLEQWTVVDTYMRQQPGFISNRLHRATTPDARYRFINYVQWRTAEHFRAAHGEHFRALVAQPFWRDFPFTGAVYEVISENAVDSAAAA